MDNSKPFSRSATGLVTGAPGARLEKYCGLVVTTAVATAPLLIRNGAGGTIVAAVPIGAAVGTELSPCIPVQCDQGVYLDLNGGTGTLSIFVDI